MMGNYQVRFRGRVMRYSHVGASPLPDCTAQQAGTHFLLRTCVDRLAQDGNCSVSAVMKQVRVKGLHRLSVKDKKGNWSEAVLEIKYRRWRVLPPVAKQKKKTRLFFFFLFLLEREREKQKTRV